MPVGRNLGLPSLVVLVVIFVILPVVGFVIRRKLRHAAARNEEIKKLLIFASEEAARAEIEATDGYFFTANTSSSIPPPNSAWAPAPESAWVQPRASVPLVSSLKPPYQCAVCFSPTSTRCAKCKAVRYCSGRCQIVHWRQGHKDECRPYVGTKDVATSCLKKEDDKDSNKAEFHEPETDSFTQSASDTSPSEESCAFSSTSRSSAETSSVSSGESDDFVSVQFQSTKVKPSNEDTTSSDFWSGTIDSKKSTIDETSSNGFGSQTKSNDVLTSKPAFKLPKATTHHVTSSATTSRLVSLSQTRIKPEIVHDEKIRVSEAESGIKKTSLLKVVDQLKLSRQCPPKAATDTAHRYSCKGLFSYEMFVKLYNWKQVELRPFGLVNCGNSCYANAVLQCLTYTPPLNAYLLQGLHSKACNKRGWCFTCELEGLVLKGAKSGSSPLSPIRILSQIQNIGSNLGHGRQEDAHEFLRYAIDTLQSVSLKEVGTNFSNSIEEEEETTIIGFTFGGYLKSKIKCIKCGGKSERHERMMDLSVEIEGDIGTLEEALDKFTRTEILDGENKYKCTRCKSYEKAKKKLTVLEAPNVLTIALKRFQSGKFGKLNKPIHFPEVLDMAPYVSGTSDKSPVYRLYGVVVHLDTMNAAFSGHYVCYVKNIQNRWFKIDDTRVKEVSLQSVLIKGAYLLLYARCSPRAPPRIRSLLSRHHPDPKKHKLPTPLTTRPWDTSHDPPIRHRTLEESSSSSSSSSDGSGIFSESCSCSTESTQDHQIPWDWEHDEYNNKSDVDTSSPSSSPSLPGVLYDWGRNSYKECNFDRLGGRPILRKSTTTQTSQS
ncbi:hypothetical protein LXL04_039137 [Taraxacum kok-saghyz]